MAKRQAPQRIPMALGLMVASGLAVGACQFTQQPTAADQDQPARAGRPPAMAAQSAPSAEPGPAAAPAVITYPTNGQGQWTYAAGDQQITGTGGQLVRYRVSVENGITGIDAATFASAAATVFADPKGWTAGGERRMQRVGQNDPAEFTLHLTTPGTRTKLCHASDRYTSCRYGDDVVINVARWVRGVPDYGAPLERYREYLINHEVGHRLGFGHQRCPGNGQPAPVMQQQTLGLHGCLANGWPRVNDKAYNGPNGEYNDPIPADQ